MIEEEGRVVGVARGKLEIEVTSPGACESCPVHSSCYSAGKTVHIPLEQGIARGDRVRFSIVNASVLKLSAVVYGTPLVGIIAGIVLGELWLFRGLADDPKTLLSFALGVLLFAGGGFFVSRIDRRWRKRIVYTVKKIAPREPETGPQGDRSGR